MKKRALTVIALCSFGFILIFASCGGGGGGGGGTTAAAPSGDSSNPFVGTWQAESVGGAAVSEPITVIFTNTEYTWSSSCSESGTYSYTDTEVTFIKKDGTCDPSVGRASTQAYRKSYAYFYESSGPYLRINKPFVITAGDGELVMKKVGGNSGAFNPNQRYVTISYQEMYNIDEGSVFTSGIIQWGGAILVNINGGKIAGNGTLEYISSEVQIPTGCEVMNTAEVSVEIWGDLYKDICEVVLTVKETWPAMTEKRCSSVPLVLPSAAKNEQVYTWTIDGSADYAYETVYKSGVPLMQEGASSTVYVNYVMLGMSVADCD